MALDDAEQAIWQNVCAQFESVPEAGEPIRLPVSYDPTCPMDIYQAVMDAQARGLFKGDDRAERAWGFLGNLRDANDPRAIMGDMAREESDDEVSHVILEFPTSGEETL